MTIKLHRCSGTAIKGRHPCWVAQHALDEAGGETEAKRRGWIRVEGRDYVVQDGDVLNIRFNV